MNTLLKYPQFAEKTLQGVISGDTFTANDNIQIKLNDGLRGRNIPYYLTFNKEGDGKALPIGNEFPLSNDMYIPYE